MTIVDPIEVVNRAIVAILDGDTSTDAQSIRSIMGRASNFACEIASLRFQRDDDSTPFLPMLAYQLYAWQQTPQNGEMWSGYVRISAFADGNDASQTVNYLLRRAEHLMTWTNFDVHGADAAPVTFRRPGPLDDLDREGSRGLTRGDLEFEMTYQVGTT